MSPTPSSDVVLVSETSALSASLDKLWADLGGKELEETHELKPEALQPFPPPLGFNFFRDDLVCNVGYFDRKEVSAKVPGIMVHRNIHSFILSLVCFIRVQDLLLPAALDAIRDNLAACLRGSAADWYSRAQSQGKLEGKNLFGLINMLQQRYGAITEDKTMKVPQCLRRREQPFRQPNPQHPVANEATAVVQSSSSSKPQPQPANEDPDVVNSEPVVDSMQPSEAAAEPHSDSTVFKHNTTGLSVMLNDWHISAPNPEEVATAPQNTAPASSLTQPLKDVDAANGASPAAAINPVVAHISIALNEQLPCSSNNAVQRHEEPAESSKKPTSPLTKADTHNAAPPGWTLLPASAANATDSRKSWTEVDASGEEGVLGEWEVV